MGTEHKVLIIGAGFGGLGMAIQLREAGVEDFVVLEKSDDVGGVWHDNLYPGAACDVPSHLYSFSFEPMAGWSRKFAPQAEILAYLRGCADKYELRRSIRCGVEAVEARFDETTSLWHVTTSQGETLRAQILITACGQLNRPAYPSIPGLDSFAGESFHSARWKPGVNLTGKRVGVIGTGASAIQIVPSIIDQVTSLDLFQRHAAYVMPKADRVYSRLEHLLFDKAPATQWLSRGRLYMAHETRVLGFMVMPKIMTLVRKKFERELTRAVKDPELRAKLTPDYPIGCKRILLSDEFYPALCKPNARVVTEPIERVSAHGIVTRDGRTHELDVIVHCTGFKATEFLAPMRVVGRGGRELNTQWRDGARAYLGMTVNGFPNLFMLYGPNTNLGHNSIIYMLESQIHYVLECLRAMRVRRLREIEVKAEAERAWSDDVQEKLAHTVWGESCDSWYKTASGRNTNNWPGFTFTYRQQTRTPDFDHYELTS